MLRAVGMKPSDSTIFAKRVACLLPVLIALAVVVAFWPSLRAEFVNWDDDANFLNNLHFRGLGWPNIRWMFTTVHMSNYQPLSWLTSAVGYSLWGMHPAGYHATSVALHAANAVLFYLVAARLLGRAVPAADPVRLSIAAAVAALYFAVHPLRTEPVAWLSAQHDLQAGTFYLLALLCHLRACSDQTRRWRWLAGSTALFAAAMLSKVNGITLPFVLLLLDSYPLRRLPMDPRQWAKPQHRTILIEKLPMLAVAIVAGLMSVLARQSTAVLAPLGLGFRVQQAFYGLAFYLGKTMVPVRLVPFYPVPLDLHLPSSTVVASIALVVILSILVVYLRRTWPAVLTAWTCYVVTLLPVLGLVSISTQLVADRYAYLPGMAWAMLVGAAVLTALRRLQARDRRWLIAGLTTVVVALSVMSWRQSKLWHDSETLFRYTLSQNPGIPEVHNDLGFFLVGQRRIDEGLAEYRKALAIKPDFTRAMNNLGLALIGQGRYPEAIDQYLRALAIEPDYAFAHNNLGLALMYLDRPAEALPHFQKAVALAPDYVVAHNNLGGALLTLGRPAEAIPHFKKALALRPDYAAAETMLRIAESQRPE
jgi:tetratricopeptide (TPR) repeat protein